MSKVLINYDQLCGLADYARRVGTIDALADVALQWAGQADKEMERLTAERDDLLTRLDLESGTVDMIARERDDLRRQLAEAEQDARRYRHLVEKHSTEVDDYGTLGITFRCDFEHYNDIDAAIDAAMGLTRPAEESNG